MKAVAYIRKSTSGIDENGVRKQSRTKPKVTFTHVEVEEKINIRPGELEEILADLLFERWLVEKGFKSNS